jgi:hypothetical protein
VGAQLYALVCSDAIHVVGADLRVGVVEIVWDSIGSISSAGSAESSMVAWFCTIDIVISWDSISA